MATTKNAQIRYKTLDQCFGNQHKKFFISDLIAYCSQVLSEYFMEEVSISRRQIFDDMNFMKSEAGFSAPIESYKEGRRTYYRYAEPDFSILKKPISNNEREHLIEALETLNRLNALSGFDWVNSLQAKLNDQLQLEKMQQPIIEFEENTYLKGLNFLNPLYQYIAKKITIEVVYKSFKSEVPYKNLLSPYFLKQYNNRWFLFAWNHRVEKIQNLALDRIVSIDSRNEEFKPQDINFTDYFDEIIGVTNEWDKPVEKISIRLSPEILPYVQSKPLHGSQKVKDSILHLEVKINYELKSLILSFGEAMTVLSPPKLVEEIKNTIQKMKNNY
ncbi:helix-turn-helix transcriptional regulator [Riemerella columbipharyngis]|uniref:Predicted DNA-binding transcriptional regulator YafY, contains an HTH and WYL domains n=1 Tax=Riemerella columbipharyngis TaxID=1071918 RepID=A0A1G7DTE9_9FLAO|nr:WYL domain-containing protein [Riemerella columbipharyngis]SDE54799.1 Predicted DNA-binding transcriptional regulator YafY, contains an HTH and WYL domains [Riemerella columbipharyngis]